MPPTGSNFMDWQQEERESLLFLDADFSWSEPPQRRRRRMTGGVSAHRALAEEPIRAQRRSPVLDYEPEPAYEQHLRQDQPARGAADPHSDRPDGVHSHFDAMMAEWNANYGAVPERETAERAFDLSDPGAQTPGQGARRTVLITGHGDERYLPAPRQRRASELRFHERSGFSPDRLGLWAVLLSIALVIGAVAH